MRRVSVPVVAAIGCVTATCGCVAGSLATNTGPLRPGHQWSTARTQQVHVGESVRFDFVLHDWQNRIVSPVGKADYCVTLVGTRRFECGPDRDGHFRVEHEFEDASAGQRISVRATAYETRSARDFARVGNDWVRVDAGRDEPDRAVAFDELSLEVYETSIAVSVPPTPFQVDPATGVLRLRHGSGKSKSVFAEQVGRRGFRVEGPDQSGTLVVHYNPTGGEVAPTGSTEVEFCVRDSRGLPHCVREDIETP